MPADSYLHGHVRKHYERCPCHLWEVGIARECAYPIIVTLFNEEETSTSYSNSCSSRRDKQLSPERQNDWDRFGEVVAEWNFWTGFARKLSINTLLSFISCERASLFTLEKVVSRKINGSVQKTHSQWKSRVRALRNHWDSEDAGSTPRAGQTFCQLLTCRITYESCCKTF